MMYRLTLPLLIFFFTACAYDNEEDLFGETSCGDEPLSLADNIQPIIATNCAIPGCHVSGAQPPDLSSAQNTANRAMRVRARTQNRTMPPASSGLNLTSEEIQQISCWVDAGANKN